MRFEQLAGCFVSLPRNGPWKLFEKGSVRMRSHRMNGKDFNAGVTTTEAVVVVVVLVVGVG